MKEKINIIQFLPYFPPHKWGLETHAQERWFWREKKWYGDVINVVFDLWYFPSPPKKGERGGSDNLILIPAVEIIPTFPIPKFRKKEFRKILSELKNVISSDITCEKSKWIVVTRTRFFTSSFLWWIFAKRNKAKRVHIEHGSDYVKLSSKFKNKVAYLYDKTLSKRIFKKANILVWVSNACKDFIQKTMKINRKVNVIYRWLDFLKKSDELKKIQVENLHKKFWWKIILWYVGRLYQRKNVESLIYAYNNISRKNKNIQLIIVWDWEDLERLKKIKHNGSVYFTWWVSKYQAINLQKQFDIHIHSSNPWWWLATTLLQAMALWLFIVATPYEWAKEVIKDWVNGILLKSDTIEEIEKWIKKALENFESKREEYKIQNQKIINEKINWENNIEKYYNLLK